MTRTKGEGGSPRKRNTGRIRNLSFDLAARHSVILPFAIRQSSSPHESRCLFRHPQRPAPSNKLSRTSPVCKCDTVEIGTGAYPGNAHCKPDELLASEGKLREFQAAVAESGLTISSLSCHGNPIHPDLRLANEHHDVFQATVKLAAKLGVEVVTTFSGCPGDGSAGAKYPELGHVPVAAGFPQNPRLPMERGRHPVLEGAGEIRRRPRREKDRAGSASRFPRLQSRNDAAPARRDERGARRELRSQPFFLAGHRPGQGRAQARRGGAIHHVHAKDTGLYKVNADYDGYLDTKPYSDEANRAWIFRTVGYGHGEEFWTDFVSTLRHGRLRRHAEHGARGQPHVAQRRVAQRASSSCGASSCAMPRAR